MYRPVTGLLVLDQKQECMRKHSVRKWKYILRFESIYFFVDKLVKKDMESTHKKHGLH